MSFKEQLQMVSDMVKKGELDDLSLDGINPHDNKQAKCIKRHIMFQLMEAAKEGKDGREVFYDEQGRADILYDKKKEKFIAITVDEYVRIAKKYNLEIAKIHEDGNTVGIKILFN